ncbi:MAG: sigma-70 family RNA polymerase sigma factor [Acidobacteria bacterium]|nr:MAG: sigma-70 family RNA polymerase sigma factor [Acidobacteriota bacterium]
MTAETLVIDEPETTANTPALLQTIRAARSGDGTAFEEIMVLTERRVAQIAWRILGDAEEVKDAMQETFLRLFRYLGKFDEKKDFVAWLSRITVNACIDLRRRRRPTAPLPELTFDAASIEDVLIQRSNRALLTQAIDTLAPRERAAILLRDVEGLPTDEVAAAMGNNIATVRVQLSRARAKLRKIIEGMQR